MDEGDGKITISQFCVHGKFVLLKNTGAIAFQQKTIQGLIVSF